MLSYNVEGGYGFIQPIGAVKWEENVHFRFRVLSDGMRRYARDGIVGKG